MRRPLLLLLFALPLLGSCAALRSAANASGVSIPEFQSPSGAQIVSAAVRAYACNHALCSAVEKAIDAWRNPATDYTPVQEYYLGRSVTASLLATEYGNVLVGVKGTGTQAKASMGLDYVQRVAQVVAAAADATAKEQRDRAPKDLRVGVVPSATPNAYSAPGGFTLITSGFIDLLRDEDELAAVLAHEMAHISLGHGLAGMSKEKRRQATEALAREVGGSSLDTLTGTFGDFVGGIGGVLLNGYPHDWEYMADLRATEILAAAGYQPAALRTVIERLAEWRKAKGATSGLAKTHPSEADRIKRLADLGAKAVAPSRAARFETAMKDVRSSAAKMLAAK